ncbi:hypothetical protein OB919_19480 [Halobacteria archaeon AArc-curdl1]|uniref:Halobacterial output domain-containing protein n=1 Tax=Natronosalvus hydrolyticus TaxID=2979988 RepID=A0AAP2ZC02_9EURY|nr:hypothetical protein [Halobacteria archaeon AArc-curdl1]
MDPSIPESVSPPSNVLLVHRSSISADACQTLCQHENGSQTAELSVTFSSDALENSPHGNANPAKIGAISVGDVLRGVTAERSTGGAHVGPDFTGDIVFDAITDPTDLSTIGVSVSRFCEQWGSDYQLTVCFQSLDALLNHAPPKTVFQFVHVLTNRLSSVDALAHFHLDPSAHDDRIVSTFGSIFDEVVVDDSAHSDVPQATDEDIAALLGEWDDPTEWPTIELTVGQEATDDDVARVLEK